MNNEELSKRFPRYSAEEILKRSGITERHMAAPDELPSDMAVKAAQKLFSEQHIDKNSIDFILFCSMIVDRQAPTTASLLQDRLGLSKNIGALDIPMGCSGYIYSLCLAKSLINGGIAKNVLILAGESLTKTVRPDDHSLAFLFGDAMSATLVTYSANEHIGEFVFGTDGSGIESLVIKGNNARDNSIPGWQEANKQHMPYGEVHMNGPDVLAFSLSVVPKMVNELLQKHHLTMNDIDVFIFHQAGSFVLEKLCVKMGIHNEKFFVNIQNKGNTSSATIPLAISDALLEKRIKKGDRILLAGFGIGLQWGCTIVTL